MNEGHDVPRHRVTAPHPAVLPVAQAERAAPELLRAGALTRQCARVLRQAVALSPPAAAASQKRRALRARRGLGTRMLGATVPAARLFLELTDSVGDPAVYPPWDIPVAAASRAFGTWRCNSADRTGRFVADEQSICHSALGPSLIIVIAVTNFFHALFASPSQTRNSRH